jgi:hypothetical protein
MNELESGLRILARIIARAYLEELSQATKQPKPLEKKKEVDTCQLKD